MTGPKGEVRPAEGQKRLMVVGTKDGELRVSIEPISKFSINHEGLQNDSKAIARIKRISGIDTLYSVKIVEAM